MRAINPLLLHAAAILLLASCSKSDNPAASVPLENVLRIDGYDYKVDDFRLMDSTSVSAYGGTSDRKGGVSLDFGEPFAAGEYPIVAYPAKGHTVSVGAITMIGGVDRGYFCSGGNSVKLVVSGSPGHYRFLLPPVEAENEIDKPLTISAHLIQ